MKFSFLCAGVALIASACLADEAANRLVPQSFESEITLRLGYHYLLATPEGYDADPAKSGYRDWEQIGRASCRERVYVLV